MQKITRMSSCSCKKQTITLLATPLFSDICLQVLEEEVKQAVKIFPPGSAGGPDGLRP